MKCNIDASFSLVANRVGIGMCLRDGYGNFIKPKTLSYCPILDVPLGEALGLHFAIMWVRELGFKDAIFELDAKFVVDVFNSWRDIISEFSSLIKDCKGLFTFF